MNKKQKLKAENHSFRERVKSTWLHELAVCRMDDALPTGHWDLRDLDFEFMSFDGHRFQFLKLASSHQKSEDWVNWYDRMFWEIEMPRYNSDSITVEIHNLEALCKAVDFAYVMKESISRQLQNETAVLELIVSSSSQLFYSESHEYINDTGFVYPKCRLIIESRLFKSEIIQWYRSIQIIAIMFKWIMLYVPFWDDIINHLESNWKHLANEIFKLLEPNSKTESHTQLLELDNNTNSNTQVYGPDHDPIKKIQGFSHIRFKGSVMNPFSPDQAKIIKILHERFMNRELSNELKRSAIFTTLEIYDKKMTDIAKKNSDFWIVVKSTRKAYYALNVD